MKHLSEVARKDGIRAVRVARDTTKHTMHLYLHAAVARKFLRTQAGNSLLQQADETGAGLMAEAEKRHRQSGMGDTLPHSWWLLRSMFRKALGSVTKWPKCVERLDAKAGGMHLVNLLFPQQCPKKFAWPWFNLGFFG